MTKTFRLLSKILFALSLVAICSCKERENEDVIISDEFKLEFLNIILSDTTELRILTSKAQLISNFGSGYMSPPFLTSHPNSSDKTISHLKNVANALNVKDTVFIRQQKLDNAKLDLNRLSDYGFNVFDLKGLVENNVPHDSILKKVDSLNIGTDNYSVLKFSVPIFNKELNLAYLRIDQGSGGNAIVLEKVKGKWRLKHEIYSWVE